LLRAVFSNRIRSGSRRRSSITDGSPPGARLLTFTNEWANGMTEKSLGIIADDLTGALDTGVQFSKWGLDSVVTLTDSFQSHVACIVINTDSRALLAREAEERVRRAARLLRGRLVYKKIDSTLRGNVGAELVVAMEELEVQKAVFVPGFPANGRTTVGGRLLVRGIPLEQTGIGRDPRNAIKESYVPRLLQEQMNEPVGLVEIRVVEQGPEAIYAGVKATSERVVVIDATTEAHLTAIAQAVLRSEGTWLSVGSAGLAEGLALALGLSKHDGRFSGWPPAQGPLLVIAGSRNDVTAAQLREAMASLELAVVEPDVQRLVAEDGAVRADEAARVSATAGQFLAEGRPTLVTACFASAIEGGALPIALGMGEITSRIMAEHSVGGLFLTGGDIAFQVCRALGGEALRPLTEIVPGLPASLLSGGAWDGLRIVTKAGGFGEKDAIVVGCHYIIGEIKHG
jgi:D-threonate/D-erythronate kinase